jgi:hypothetical protein
VSLCNLKFTFEEFLQDVDGVFGENINIFYLVLKESYNVIKVYARQPERCIILNGMMNIIFSPIYDKIDNEMWAYIMNAVVENLWRKKKNRIGSLEVDDVSTKSVTTGSSSSFQKLSWFKNQVIFTIECYSFRKLRQIIFQMRIKDLCKNSRTNLQTLLKPFLSNTSSPKCR